MALQATEQGSHPSDAAAAVDPSHPRQPMVAAPPSFPTGGEVVGCDKGTAAAGLPDEILLEILSRLPVKALFRFKCVSKAWLGLVTDCLRKVPQTLQGLFYTKRDGKYGRFFNLLGESVPPIDPSFSFLPKLPEIEEIILMDSCNGLVLFWHRELELGSPLGYFVCNPATMEWVAVPRSGDDCNVQHRVIPFTRLFFDPAVSSRFELVEFWLLFADGYRDVSRVHTYSSESRAWSRRETEWWSNELINTWIRCAFVDGMVHFYESHNVIVAIDGRAEKRRIILWPEEERGSLVFLGQSQGLLHCMSGHRELGERMTELSIWALEDHGTERWILKDSVNCMQLFGEGTCSFEDAPITIHPDRGLALFFHLESCKLVSYDMDSKEVSDLCTLDGWIPMTPYVPYFVESSMLAKER